ncbi:MAG: hypothetical protein WC455_13910 [Dehalococcoidia bacterium]|jgi:hypothetical protein
MAIIAKAGGSVTFEKPSTGEPHRAVLSNIYGPFISSYEWQGKKVTSNKVILMFELDQTIKEGEFAGKRFTVSEKFTLSLGEKSKLRPFIEAWAGKPFTADEQVNGFDIEVLIGKNCNLNLIEKPKKNGAGKSIVIASIFPRMKGQEPMSPELPRSYMPKWVADLLGVQSNGDSQQSPDNFEDDIPF